MTVRSALQIDARQQAYASAPTAQLEKSVASRMRNLSFMCSHSLHTQQQQLSLHRGMNRAPEFVPARTSHVETDGRVALRVKIHASDPSPVDDRTVLFNGGGNPFEHCRSEIVPFGIFILYLDHSRHPETEDTLLR